MNELPNLCTEGGAISSMHGSERVRIERRITQARETPLPEGMAPTLLLDGGTQGRTEAMAMSALLNDTAEYVQCLPIEPADLEDERTVEELLAERRTPQKLKPLTRRFRS